MDDKAGSAAFASSAISFGDTVHDWKFVRADSHVEVYECVCCRQFFACMIDGLNISTVCELSDYNS